MALFSIVLVLGIAGAASTVTLTDETLFTAIHHDLRPGNPFFISEATGIPRETVRRKFTELVKEGLVEKVKPKSYVITARVSERFIHSFNLQLFEETHRLCSKINAIITQTKPDYPTMIKP
jgi:hypothetical protein